MLRIRRLTLCFALILCLAGAARSEEALVPTSAWTPPDLSEATTSTPQLLILKVAQEEVGYVEGPLKDQSKYGEWMGKKQTAWCAEFLTWCVDQVDQRYGTSLMNTVYPYYDSPENGYPFFQKQNRYIPDTGRLANKTQIWSLADHCYITKDSYIPEPGEYMWFWYYNRDQGSDHVAIVEGVSADTDGTVIVHVIEGNNPDSVQRNTYALTDSTILGYGTYSQKIQRNMRLYFKGDDVAKLQDDLAALGWYTKDGDADGEFTVALRKAVSAYQKAHVLEVSGVVDMDTYLMIQDEL